MKTTITTLLAALTVFTLSVTATEAVASSERGALAASAHVRTIYTVDETQMFVIGDREAVQDQWITTKYSIEGENEFTAYMVEHRASQPVVYKNGAALSRLPGAAVTLTVEELSHARSSLTGVDLFEMATTQCAAGGGTTGYVVPKTYGNYKRLTRIGAVEAFDYILLKGDKGGAWFIGCENADERKGNFLVTKNYSFLNGDVEKAEFTYGRTLNGVNYEESTIEAEIAIARVMALKGEMPILAEGEFLDEMARKIADIKLEMIMPNEGSRYLGSYRTAAKMGCDDVTIKHLRKRVIEKNSIARVYEYRVCGDEVALLDDTVIENTEDTTRTILASYNTTYLASNGR